MLFLDFLPGNVVALSGAVFIAVTGAISIMIVKGLGAWLERKNSAKAAQIKSVKTWVVRVLMAGTLAIVAWFIYLFATYENPRLKDKEAFEKAYLEEKRVKDSLYRVENAIPADSVLPERK